MILQPDPALRPDLKAIIDHPWLKGEDPTSTPSKRTGPGTATTLPGTQSNTGRVTSPPVVDPRGLASSPNRAEGAPAIAHKVSAGMGAGKAANKRRAAAICPNPGPPAVTSPQLAQPAVVKVPARPLPALPATAKAGRPNKELTENDEQKMHLTCRIGGATVAKVALTSSQDIGQAVRQVLEDSASLVKLQMQKGQNPRRSLPVDSSGKYIVRFRLIWDMALSTEAAVETKTTGRGQGSREPATVAVLSGSDQPSRGRQTTGGQPQPSPKKATRAKQAREQHAPPPTVEEVPTRGRRTKGGQPQPYPKEVTHAQQARKEHVLPPTAGQVPSRTRSKPTFIIIHSESRLGETGKSQAKHPRLAATRSLANLQYNNIHNLHLPLSNDIHRTAGQSATETQTVLNHTTSCKPSTVATHVDLGLEDLDLDVLPIAEHQVAPAAPSTCELKPPSGYATKPSTERGGPGVGLERENPTPLHNTLTLSEGPKMSRPTTLFTTSGAPVYKARPTNNQVCSQAYGRPKKRSIWRRIRRLFRSCLPSSTKVGAMYGDMYMVGSGVCS